MVRVAGADGSTGPGARVADHHPESTPHSDTQGLGQASWGGAQVPTWRVRPDVSTSTRATWSFFCWNPVRAWLYHSPRGPSQRQDGSPGGVCLHVCALLMFVILYGALSAHICCGYKQLPKQPTCVFSFYLILLCPMVSLLKIHSFQKLTKKQINLKAPTHTPNKPQIWVLWCLSLSQPSAWCQVGAVGRVLGACQPGGGGSQAHLGERAQRHRVGLRQGWGGVRGRSAAVTGLFPEVTGPGVTDRETVLRDQSVPVDGRVTAWHRAELQCAWSPGQSPPW